jgi:hypothetical protein
VVHGLAASDLAGLPDPVRAERALFGGPLAATARAVTEGEVSVAHARVLAHATHDLPTHLTAACKVPGATLVASLA